MSKSKPKLYKNERLEMREAQTKGCYIVWDLVRDEEATDTEDYTYEEAKLWVNQDSFLHFIRPLFVDVVKKHYKKFELTLENALEIAPESLGEE